ncbi:cytochrome c oxidase subunit I [Bryocella elongata]|uniref:cytochrome c oxidase subunit I n=1 Tax=Bryocella elongata TaxID=863522 RepID=UPI001F2877BC|nr:cbb3-type cytochrome c oxidase subunit I [Bryocella elongata]
MAASPSVKPGKPIEPVALTPSRVPVPPGPSQPSVPVAKQPILPLSKPPSPQKPAAPATPPPKPKHRRRPILPDLSPWTEHRTVGFGYLAVSIAAILVGTVLSLLMRAHLSWPAWKLPLHGLILPEEYLALVTMHGTLMLFFVLTVAPQSGFSNIILPSQIGADRMAFPRLNLLGLVLTAAALVVLLAAFFVPGGAPISGWTAYPPLSASALAGPGQGLGLDIWLGSLVLFSLASTLGAINTLTTIVKLRCEGMTWDRLPLTVWSWFTAAMLSVLAFSVLLAALLLLNCDRHLGTSFFLPAGDLINGTLVRAVSDVASGGGILSRAEGSPLLWLHLFWFFGHPEVYIAILPGMGLTSMVLANFSRRRVFAWKIMIATTLLIGLLGILVWGHHMFVAGLNPFAGTVFGASSLAIAIPSSAKVLSWITTVWRGRPRRTTAFLFALGFVSFFIAGGLTGPILAQPILDEYLHNTFFVVGHFHLIMAMSGVFGLFCATYYWAPILFGQQLDERLGRIHFWTTLVFAYSTFLPMYTLGLRGEPRHYAELPTTGSAGHLLQGAIAVQQHITASALLLALAQLPFLWSVYRAWRSRRDPALLAQQNPWFATTLEWAPALAPDAQRKVYREPCVYSPDGDIFDPQWDEDAEIK